MDPMPHLPALRLEDVSKCYSGRPVLDGVTLEVNPGEILGVVGPNGAGKTTLIRIVTGLVRPASGRVEAFGRALPDASAYAQLGALIERPSHFEWLDARRNLVISSGRGLRAAREAIDSALELVGLKSNAKQRVSRFSDGMSQRLAIAGALLGDPKLLILDEPTNGLDPIWIKNLREILLHRRAGGTAVLLTSHLLSEVEKICDRVALLEAGRVACVVGPSELDGEGQWVRVRVASPDVSGALAALNQHELERETDGTILVKHSSTREVSRRLREAGIDPEELAPVRRTLEDRLFLHPPTTPESE